MDELLVKVPMASLFPWGVAIALNTLLAAVAWVAPKKLLTPAGLLHAWFLGVLIWGMLGWQGYLIIMVYFLAGSTVTRLGLEKKEASGIAEKRSGARGPENVWGSALVGTLCAIGIFVLSMPSAIAPSVTNGWIASLWLGYVASLSTKLSDTSASEVGKAYGQRTFLITTLKPAPPGTEGAVSLEGTLAGIVASVVIALIGWAVGVITIPGIVICVIAAFVATNVESVIGATLQDTIDWLTNEVVNMINTLIGASVAIALLFLWQSL